MSDLSDIEEFLRARGIETDPDLQVAKKATKKKAAKKTTKKVKATPPPADDADKGKVIDPLVYRSEHYYLRPGFSWNEVLDSAKEAATINERSVRVFAHKHQFGEECIPACRERVNSSTE